MIRIAIDGIPDPIYQGPPRISRLPRHHNQQLQAQTEQTHRQRQCDTAESDRQHARIEAGKTRAQGQRHQRGAGRQAAGRLPVSPRRLTLLNPPLLEGRAAAA